MATLGQLKIMEMLQKSRQNGVNAIKHYAGKNVISELANTISYLRANYKLADDEMKEKLADMCGTLMTIRLLLENDGVLEDVSSTESIDVGFSSYDFDELADMIMCNLK